MKPVDFAYERPTSLAAALDLLARDDCAVRVMAGAQSLGPMLNLRLAQPDLVVDITAIAELTSVRREKQALAVGACVTHARLEDGAARDRTGEVLAAIAGGIAYRAVRNRGTIGGSLAHADPSADWVVCAAALGAELLLASKAGQRTVAAAEFMVGPFETALQPGEVLVEVRLPWLSERARWGYCKFCRKAGEFAQASAAVLCDPARDVQRCVIGATSGCPVVIDDPQFMREGGRSERVTELLSATPLGDDPFAVRTHAVVLRRALERAGL
ncbi:MAG TPA: FAD binding domain-containing protein [Acetobacteraceae bacterium]